MATADLKLLTDRRARLDSPAVCYCSPAPPPWQSLTVEKAHVDAQIIHIRGSQTQVLAR